MRRFCFLSCYPLGNDSQIFSHNVSCKKGIRCKCRHGIKLKPFCCNGKRSSVKVEIIGHYGNPGIKLFSQNNLLGKSHVFPCAG